MKKLIIIPVLTLLLFAGCRSTPPVQNNFFLLELPPALMEEVQRRGRTIDATFEIMKVEVATPYASHQIAIREDSHRMRYFSFNEWANRPGQSFSNMTFSYLEEGRFFHEIVTGRHRVITDYTMNTKVHRLEVDQTSGVFEARFIVEFRLLNTATQEVIVVHRADRSQPLEENSLNLFAAAVSNLFSEELTAFMDLVLDKLYD